MKTPRLRADVQPDLSKANQIACSRCKCQIFDEKFVIFKTSELAPVNPGKIEKMAVMSCTCCNTVLVIEKDSKPGEEGK